MRSLLPLAILLLAVPVASQEAPVEGRSMLGEPLPRIELQGERRQHYQRELAAARERWRAGGKEIDAIWAGRHLAYLGRYREAITWYTGRLNEFPTSVRLRRHRGHRHLSLRNLDAAVADLSAARELARETEDAVEPDGAPNELGIPRSTTHTNVLYHLGLAHYLAGDFERAADVFGRCAGLSPNDDSWVSAANWQVHALRRLGREGEAQAVLERVQPEMDVIENHAYHRLLLLQKGVLGPEEVVDPDGDGVQDATSAYGVASWTWWKGEHDAALEAWRRIVRETPWNAFGHLAAECELARRAQGDVVFGAMADAQYVDAGPNGERLYRSGAPKLREAVDFMNGRELAFVVHLGDLIDRFDASYDVVLPIWEDLRAPGHLVLGNHEFDVSPELKPHVPELLGREERYWDFALEGWRFVVLDGNAMSHYAWPEGSPEHARSLAYYAERDKAVPRWNGALGDEQTAWLEERLDAADQAGERVLVLCHFPVHPHGYNLADDVDVRNQLARHPSVKAYFAGHDHAGGYGLWDGVHFVTMRGMVNTTENAYAVVTLGEHTIRVDGFGREPDRLLRIRAGTE
jgi:tetratricopeptide (TPR) repeat protein